MLHQCRYRASHRYPETRQAESRRATGNIRATSSTLTAESRAAPHAANGAAEARGVGTAGALLYEQAGPSIRRAARTIPGPAGLITAMDRTSLAASGT
jgi:hypothetical protein